MKKALLVASTGGHLAQLVRLAPTLPAGDDSLWVTFRTPQSESLLKGRRVVYVPYVRPRDWRGALGVGRVVARILRQERFDIAVSTGAAPAVTSLPLAKLRGVETTYIESVSRVKGPSLSGRMVAALGAAKLFTQHPGWAKGRWKTHKSVFETFRRTAKTPTDTPSIFVTLGTIEGYRFDAMIDAVLATGLVDERTVWQLGFSTGRTDLPGKVFDQVSAAEFDHFARDADVVVSHAGVGSLLGLLDLGVFPVLVVRRKARNEHVDDHQAQIAQLADEQGVALSAEATDLDAALLIRASGYDIADLVAEESVLT